MAKRFIDTDIFKKLRALKDPYRTLYIYMTCECNHAGFWTVELDVAGFRLGSEFDESETIKALGNKIEVINSDTWYLVDFIDFQYGTLKEDNRVHRSVMEILKKHNKGLKRPVKGRKDKDKDKDKAKIKDNIIPFLDRIAALKSRRGSTDWSKKEIEHLNGIKSIDECEMVLLETFYSADIPEDTDYRRVKMETLLGNWTGEIDKARAFKPAKTDQEQHEDKWDDEETTYKPKKKDNE